MEYTKSVGDVYETFEGTPEEIAKLLKLMDKSNTLSCSGVIKDKRELLGGAIPYKEGSLDTHRSSDE